MTKQFVSRKAILSTQRQNGLTARHLYLQLDPLVSDLHDMLLMVDEGAGTFVLNQKILEMVLF
jgi:hypothetical protein